MLVNNAGFDEPGFFVDTDPDRWGRLLGVDLVGVLNCTHVFAGDIAANSRETGYGRIVNIASDAGRVGSMGQAVYSAAKGGVIAFSKTMARELARDRVTVNTVCPGPADTPMTEGINEDPLGRKMMGGMLAVTPFKRLVTPDEVAAAVEFFGSEDARFITGQVLSVSGGLTMSG
jgi:2-hydroxycyclohexanecarboxyl-CoA dehydrogenase